MTQKVLCTYSQIFQDWSDLQVVILHDQHVRWYKHQQDPRYYTPTVVDMMVAHYKASVKKYGHETASKFA